MSRQLACDCPVVPLPRLVVERATLPGGPEALLAAVAAEAPALLVDLPAEVRAATVDVIAPDARAVHAEHALDAQPLAVKLEGRLGTGRTRVLDGAVLLLTASEASGPVVELGNTAGLLAERLDPRAPGTPDPADVILRVHVELADGASRRRAGPQAAHAVAERVAERVRELLRALPGPFPAVEHEEPRSTRGPAALRVLLVKVVMGQGAMHEKTLLPHEPAGLAGGRSIIDIGHGPVVLRANEARDGGIRSLCCISPSTKETTLHAFRDPLLLRLADDPAIDLVGVAVVGSPAAEVDKLHSAERVGALVSTLAPDGVIVATEGFGNNHIDWAHAIAECVRYGTPTVGVTWAAHQGRLVVGDEHLVALVEVNHATDGRESLVLGENTCRPEDAERAVAMLRTFAAGIAIEPAPRAYDPAAVRANAALVAAAGAGGIAPGLRSEVPVDALAPPPLARLRVPLREARVAVLTGAGALLAGDAPFRAAGDATLRELPADVALADVTFGVSTYDHADVQRDPDVMLPVATLRALADAGEIGALAGAFGIHGGGADIQELKERAAPLLLDRLRAMHADALLMTGG